MNILIVSHQHGLLPFAWRLRKEGHSVEVCVITPRYDKAWGGLMPKVPRNAANRVDLEPWKGRVATGELTVLTDSIHARDAFLGAPSLNLCDMRARSGFAVPLLLGAWWDGAAWHDPHWLVQDWGLGPGGFGVQVLSGLTLVRGAQATQLLEGIEPTSPGLVQVPLSPDGAGRPVAQGHAVGLRWLHAHAWVGELANFGEVLGGATPIVEGGRWTVTLPVSQAPWPTERAGGPAPTPLLLPKEVAANCFFHDIVIEDGNAVRTGGLDGLVAVVRGSAASFELARQRALHAAGALHLPDRQVRSDVGSLVPLVVAGLDEQGLW